MSDAYSFDDNAAAPTLGGWQGMPAALTSAGLASKIVQ